jgi:hypothetical protein
VNLLPFLNGQAGKDEMPHPFLHFMDDTQRAVLSDDGWKLAFRKWQGVNATLHSIAADGTHEENWQDVFEDFPTLVTDLASQWQVWCNTTLGLVEC